MLIENAKEMSGVRVSHKARLTLNGNGKIGLIDMLVRKGTQKMTSTANHLVVIV